MPDWNAIATWGMSGLAFGAGFSFCCYLAIRMIAVEILGSEVVQALAKAAAKFAGVKGDWKSAIASGAIKIGGKLLDRLL